MVCLFVFAHSFRNTEIEKMFYSLPLFGVMFLFLGSFELVHHERTNLFVLLLSGIQQQLIPVPCLGSPFLLSHPCFLTSPVLYHYLVRLFQDAPRHSLSVTLCASPIAYQVLQGIHLQLETEESTGAQSFYTMLSFLCLCTMENNFEKL